MVLIKELPVQYWNNIYVQKLNKLSVCFAIFYLIIIIVNALVLIFKL